MENVVHYWRQGSGTSMVGLSMGRACERVEKAIFGGESGVDIALLSTGTCVG